MDGRSAEKSSAMETFITRPATMRLMYPPMKAIAACAQLIASRLLVWELTHHNTGISIRARKTEMDVMIEMAPRAL